VCSHQGTSAAIESALRRIFKDRETLSQLFTALEWILWQIAGQLVQHQPRDSHRLRFIAVMKQTTRKSVDSVESMVEWRSEKKERLPVVVEALVLGCLARRFTFNHRSFCAQNDGLLSFDEPEHRWCLSFCENGIPELSSSWRNLNA